MRITFDLPEYQDGDALEGDLEKSFVFLDGLKGRRYRNDEKVIALQHLVASLLENYKQCNWPLFYLFVSKKPEKHDSKCDCNECYPSLLGRRVYRGYLFAMDDYLIGQRKSSLFQSALQQREYYTCFSAESYDTVVRHAREFCEKRKWYLYDPISGYRQEF